MRVIDDTTDEARHRLTCTGASESGSLFRAVYRRLPPAARDSLSFEQVEGLRIATDELSRQSRHVLDVRLTLPSPLGRIYVVLLGGRDRRSGFRPHQHHWRPGVRIANAFSLAVLAAMAASLLAAFWSITRGS